MVLQHSVEYMPINLINSSTIQAMSPHQFITPSIHIPRAFDVITNAPGEGTVPTKDFAKLLTDMPSNCDYSLGPVEVPVNA